MPMPDSINITCNKFGKFTVVSREKFENCHRNTTSHPYFDTVTYTINVNISMLWSSGNASLALALRMLATNNLYSISDQTIQDSMPSECREPL